MLKNQKQLRTSKALSADGTPRTEAGMVSFEEFPEEKTVVVAVNRVTKVVKGGKRFSFNALVVVGDGNGRVGAGLGKSNEVQSAIQKATACAKKEMFEFPVEEGSIPHEIEGRFGAGHVWMKPAVGGTGLIAGGGVRAVLEAAGVHNILTKNLGSRNSFNTVYATVDALRNLRSRAAVMKLRGLA